MAMTAGLAGCGALVGSDEDYPYLDWAGAAVIEDDTNRTMITSSDPSAYREVFDRGSQELERGFLGQEPDDVEYRLGLSAMGDGWPRIYSVLVGDVALDSALDVMEDWFDLSFNSTEDYHSYEVYQMDGGDMTLGGSDETLISASDRESFRIAVDAEAGDESRLVDEDDRVSEIDSRIDYQDGVYLELYEEGGYQEDLQAWGGSYELGEDESDVSSVFILPDADEAESVAEFLENASGSFEFEGIQFDGDDVSDVTADGRVVTVEAVLSTEQLPIAAGDLADD